MRLTLLYLYILHELQQRKEKWAFCPTRFGVRQNAQGGGLKRPGVVGQNAQAKILFGLRGAKRPCGAKSPSRGKRPMGVLPLFAQFLVGILI